MPPSARDHHFDVEEPQDYVERKPFRWGRFVVLSVLLLVIVVLLGHWWWSRRGEKALLAQMAEYAQRGEPAALEDFEDEDIPDAMNAAVDLRAAAAALASTNVDDRRRALDVALFLPLNEREMALLQKFTADHAKAFEHVQAARTKPGINWNIQVQSPMIATLLPDLNGQKEVTDLLNVAALLAHQQGDDAAAIGHIEDMMFVARSVRKQPFLVSLLVSIRIESLAGQRLRQIAPDLRIAGATVASSGKPADRERVRQLIAELLDESATRAGFRRAMQAERLAQFDGTMLLAKGNTQFMQGVAGVGPGSAALPIALLAGVLRPIVYEDGVMMVRYTTAAGDAAREETWPAARAKMPAFPMDAKRSPLHFNAQLLMPALDAALERHYRVITERRATALILALRLYAIDHGGNLPERLDDLVPKYLPNVPVDPFSPNSEPLKYRLAQQPIVYSVSANGADDAGSQLNQRGQSAKSEWDALDTVFHLTRQPKPVEEEPEPEIVPDLPVESGSTPEPEEQVEATSPQ